MGTDNEGLLKNIRYYQDSLDKYSSINNNYKLLSIIKKLKKLPIATSHLEATGIGRTVNGLRKLGGEVGDAAKTLVTRWKEMVVQEDVKTKEDADEESPNDSSYKSEGDTNRYDEKENSYAEIEHTEKEKTSSHRSSDETVCSDKQRSYLEKRSTEKNSLIRKDRDRDSNKYERNSSEKYSSRTRDNSASSSDSEEETYEEKYRKSDTKSDSKKNGSYSEDEGSTSSEEEEDERHSEKHKKETKKGGSSRPSDKKEKRDDKKHKSESKNRAERHSSKRKHHSSSSSESEEEETYDSRYKKSDSKSHRNDSEEDKSRSKHEKQRKDVEKSSSSSSGHHKASHNKKDERDKERSSKKHKYEQDKSPKRHSSKRKRSSSPSESEEEDYHRTKSDNRHRSDSDEEEERKHNSRKSEEKKSHKSRSSKSDRHEANSNKSKSREKTESKPHDYSSSKGKSTSKSNSSSVRELHDEGVKSGSKYKEKINHDSSDGEEAKEKSKSKHEKESDKSRESKTHSSHSDKHEKKDKKDKVGPKRDDSKHHEEKQKSSKEEKEDRKEKTPTSSSSKSREGKGGSSKSGSEKKSKVKIEPVINEKIKNGIDSESGASFAEALGMCAPIMLNKSASGSKKKSGSTPSPMKKSKTSSSGTSAKSERSETTDEKYVPNLLMEQPPEPLQLNISSLLPEITPNYKPVAFPLDTQPKRLLTPDEALSQAISNKNVRMKVYSGNKTKGGEVESLFNICVKILQDNLDAMEGTGGVPYIILKPILEKATPDQLFNMEHHNPYLIEDTDELWRLHCMKEFRTKRREEMETWREMYMRCLDEREAKLHAIAANIKQSQKESVPVRQTKMAFMDSIVKPPRNIARKQAKNGFVMEKSPSKTPSSRLAALATSGEAGKVSVPNPGSRAVNRTSGSGSSSALKPKKAPLMAKTLSLLKNRFKR